MHGKSTHLRARDIRDVMRLVCEMRTFDNDPVGWRIHAGKELSRLIGAAVAMTIQANFTPEGPLVAAMTDSGWQDTKQRQVYYGWLASQEFKIDPFMDLVSRLGNTTYGFNRGQVLDDLSWYAAGTVSEVRRAAGVDDCAFSSVSLPDGTVNQFAMHRPWGDTCFSRRDSVLLSLFHHELQRLWIADAQRQSPVQELPPYLRRTLDALLEGYTEKEAATHLKLTTSTIHTYVKQMYRLLKVGNRIELMYKFGSRNLGPPLTIVSSYSKPAELNQLAQ
jgi:DNA-binding CsgD family transcriptional regulator